MSKQIITITPEGTVSGLQVKPGKGLDLTKLGKASVVRASEIVWNEEHQAWKIDVLQDAGKGVVTDHRYREAGGFKTVAGLVGNLDRLAPAGWRVGGEELHGPLLFTSYDDAVKVEIAYLDALRLQGVF